MFQWSWGQIWPGQLCFNGAGVKILLGSFMFEWSWGLSCPGQLYVSVELGSKLSWAALCHSWPAGGGGGGEPSFSLLIIFSVY